MTVARNEFIELVNQLHGAVGYVHPSEPTLLSDGRRELWLRLISEEVAEFGAALAREDLVGVADALGDCLYVIVGASLAFGIPLEAVFREIHRSNLTKDVISLSSETDSAMEIKLHKGPNYVPPDLAAILRRSGP